MSKIDNFPYPTPPAKIWGCSLWSRSVMLGSAESEIVRLISREIILAEFEPIWSRYLNVTDRRTDRRTTCHGNTALRVASRGKKSLIRILGIRLTSSNINRFSKFVHSHNLLEICNKGIIINYPTKPNIKRVAYFTFVSPSFGIAASRACSVHSLPSGTICTVSSILAMLQPSRLRYFYCYDTSRYIVRSAIWHRHISIEDKYRSTGIVGIAQHYVTEIAPWIVPRQKRAWLYCEQHKIVVQSSLLSRWFKWRWLHTFKFLLVR